jgi:hypothetical protein
LRGYVPEILGQGLSEGAHWGAAHVKGGGGGGGGGVGGGGGGGGAGWGGWLSA